ncbi:alpha/beta hydrolase [Mycobacterium spongiae]|uniref:Alpha/beta hydrolase fold domain-containing protein n=1 Tax=Mycobacterium spongiae TaxID=886343 RepID=A0A975JUK0_9MYCO|nr:alpha/beta hydrolase [Mycobacterium spongiae]QUR65970.1 alpha/beta hydrolase fold domain-containing protein [Mycobacterium spongiae]
MPGNDAHPDLRRVAHFVPRQLVGRRTLPLVRAWIAASGRTSRTPRDVEVITLTSGVGVRVYRPVGSSEPAPALLWIHGGGYVTGTARHDDWLCRRFSKKLGITVASVEYRLAPEHPYPAPLEDCHSALTWLVGLPAVDPERVAVGGASAGGGLAAALALLARDRGDIAPVFQLLVYPMLDDRSSRLPANPRYRLWNARANGFGWRAYLGDADPQIAVPARRDNLRGLPPAWIGVGNHDLFHDENLAYAERLTAAGVPCHIEVVDGAFHGFDHVAPNAAVSQRFFDSQCTSLSTGLTPVA